MAEHSKAELDAMTDNAARIVRGAPLDGPMAEYARHVAGFLAVQFPGVPDLDRVVVACAHYMSAIGAEWIGGATLVRILAEAGLRIGEARGGDAGDAQVPGEGGAS